MFLLEELLLPLLQSDVAVYVPQGSGGKCGSRSFTPLFSTMHGHDFKHVAPNQIFGARIGGLDWRVGGLGWRTRYQQAFCLQ